MRKIFLLLYILLFFICVCASCQNDDKVIFQKGIPGLERLELKNDTIRPVRFSSDGLKIVYSKYLEGEESRRVYEYNIKKKTEKLIFSPYDYYYFEGKNSAGITNILFTTKDSLVINSEVFYHIDKFDSFFKEILLKVNPDGSVTIVSDRDSDDYSSKMIQSTVDRTTAIAHSVFWGDSFLMYKLESAEGKIIKTPYQNYGTNYCSGINLDEVVVCDETEKGKLFLHFYDTKTEKDRKTIQVPENVIKDVHGNYFDGILLSPDGKYLILNNAAFGVWIFDTTTDKFFNLLYTYDAEKGSRRDVYVYDWSWDSRYIALRVSRQVYIMDLYKFMESRK